MRVDTLRLTSFRNYREQEASFSPGSNVIVGENAQGKTNLLEALVYLSCGKSPRTRSDREMIGFEADSAGILAGVRSRERDFRLEISLFRDRRRKISVNKVAAKNASALSQVFNTVYFRPEDLSLIREGAAARRRFLDTALCQLRPRYASALGAYSRCLDQKTRILRDSGEFPGLLDALPEFNAQMVRLGAAIVHYRARFSERLREYAAAQHRECSGGREELDVRYDTVSSVRDPLGTESEIAADLAEHMERHKDAERAARMCLSGPHKDDLIVEINGRDARSFASQGQTRTAALSLKLAEREIDKNAAGEYPVLLLDDVLSELDPRRQEFVLNRIAGGQVFITCCEEDRLTELLGGRVFRVREGSLEEA